MIIEFYGPSGSGKTFEAYRFYKSNKNFLINFLFISKKNVISRIISKLFFLFFLKPKDIYNIYLLHNSFIFYSRNKKIKNFLAFLYLCGFLRFNLKKNNDILLDHGFFQLLLSCYILSKSINSNHDIIRYLKLTLKDFIANDYRITKTNQNLSLSKERLIKREGNAFASKYYQSYKKIDASLVEVNFIIDQIL